MSSFKCLLFLVIFGYTFAAPAPAPVPNPQLIELLDPLHVFHHHHHNGYGSGSRASASARSNSAFAGLNLGLLGKYGVELSGSDAYAGSTSNSNYSPNYGYNDWHWGGAHSHAASHNDYPRPNSYNYGNCDDWLNSDC